MKWTGAERTDTRRPIVRRPPVFGLVSVTEDRLQALEDLELGVLAAVNAAQKVAQGMSTETQLAVSLFTAPIRPLLIESERTR